MPSNTDLIDSIKELNAEAVTDGLSNAQLAEMLKTERAKKAEAARIAAEEEAAAQAAKEAADAEAKALAAQAEADAAKVAASKTKQFRIATGKAVTSLRGILADGAIVSASDFIGGKDTLDALKKSGHVVFE